jgi:hypothetical protein
MNFIKVKDDLRKTKKVIGVSREIVSPLFSKFDGYKSCLGRFGKDLIIHRKHLSTVIKILKILSYYFGERNALL